MKECNKQSSTARTNSCLKSIKRIGRNRRSSLRNTYRRQRRRRSHNRYYKNLRQLRKRREYEALCSEVEAFAVFDISSDMDWKTGASISAPPVGVNEWHQKEQVAFWKSRAISLEYENRMLYRHLRDVYAQNIQSYGKHYSSSAHLNSKNHIKNTKSKVENIQEHPVNDILYTTYVDQDTKNMDRYTEISMDISDSQKKPNLQYESDINSIFSQPPSEPIGKKRREEMEQLYGSCCPQIAGIETALQLNYEHTAAKYKPAYWPQLQLNLG